MPFYLGLVGAFLTAFYMTRQVCCVFFGKPATDEAEHAHESPPVMTVPLVILAVFAVLAGFFGTPAWPWFQSYSNGEQAGFDLSKLMEADRLPVMLLSTAWSPPPSSSSGWLYGRAAARPAQEPDPLETAQPALFACLQEKFYMDEFYAATVIRLTTAFATFSDWLDRVVWDGLVRAVSRADGGAGAAQSQTWTNP